MDTPCSAFHTLQQVSVPYQYRSMSRWYCSWPKMSVPKMVIMEDVIPNVLPCRLSGTRNNFPKGRLAQPKIFSMHWEFRRSPKKSNPKSPEEPEEYLVVPIKGDLNIGPNILFLSMRTQKGSHCFSNPHSHPHYSSLPLFGHQFTGRQL